MTRELPDWRTSNRHLYLGGSTRSGKTTLGIQLHAEIPDRICIYWHSSRQDAELIRGREVNSLEELASALYNGHHRINYHHNDEMDWSGEDDFRRFVDLIFAVADRAEDTEFMVFVDECHEYVSSQSPDKDNRLMRLVKRGAGRGIKCCLITQNPQDMPNSALDNCLFHAIVGSPSSQMVNYLDRYSYDVGSLQGQEPGVTTLYANDGETVAEFRAHERYTEAP